MPTRYPHTNRAKNMTIGGAAALGMIVTMRCTLCRREAHYWAADLVQVLGAAHQAHIVPWPCSRCRTKDFLSVRWDIPSLQRLSEIIVRRPVKQVSVWLWRNEKP